MERRPLLYWDNLIALLTKPNPLRDLDTPLDVAIPQNRMSSFWAGLWLFAGLSVRFHAHWSRAIRHTGFSVVGQWLLGSCLAVIGATLMMLITYSLVRLYTLVSHVMVSNVFKVRGQRLRLLNIETALLPLVSIMAAALGATAWSPWTGWLVFAAAASYGGVWMSVGYNVVFHQRNSRGIVLFIGGFALSMFIFCVGAIAVSMGLGVLAFLAAALTRPLWHHN